MHSVDVPGRVKSLRVEPTYKLQVSYRYQRKNKIQWQYDIIAESQRELNTEALQEKKSAWLQETKNFVSRNIN